MRRYHVHLDEPLFVSANVPPTAPDGTETIVIVAGGESVVIDLIALGIDDGGDGPSPAVLDATFLGTLPFTQNGVTMTSPSATEIEFTTDGSEAGTFTFDYTVTDGASTSTGTITLTVDPPQGPTVAATNVPAINGNPAITIDPFLSGDACPGAAPCGTPCTVTFDFTGITAGTPNYTAGDTFFQYLPPVAGSGAGTDTVCYDIEDCYGQSTSNCIDFNYSDDPLVGGGNATVGPFVHDQSPNPTINVCTEAGITGGVPPLVVSIDTPATVGVATATGTDCNVDYDPANCNRTDATDSFVYTVTDGGGQSVSGTITVNLTKAEDAPTLSGTGGNATTGNPGSYDAAATLSGGEPPLTWSIPVGGEGTGEVSGATVDTVGIVSFNAGAVLCISHRM